MSKEMYTLIAAARVFLAELADGVGINFQAEGKMKGYVMASNFEITTSNNSEIFVLTLDGDFDATSAYELIYAIKKLPEDTVKIYVNTNGLKKIHPSGLDVLSGFMNSLNGQSARIVLTGHNHSRLSPANLSPPPKTSNFFLDELRSPNAW